MPYVFQVQEKEDSDPYIKKRTRDLRGAESYRKSFIDARERYGTMFFSCKILHERKVNNKIRYEEVGKK